MNAPIAWVLLERICFSMPLALPGFLRARRYSTYSLNKQRAFLGERERALGITRTSEARIFF